MSNTKTNKEDLLKFLKGNSRSVEFAMFKKTPVKETKFLKAFEVGASIPLPEETIKH